ncbi:MAG: glycoside hydrolase family 130 protein [Firmicutes bacterium]|nr:glycoside hydrolase family 130 protein [Bacillota bacterium]
MEPVRFSGNPIVRPQDVAPSAPGLEVIGAFNAGAVQFGEETVLLLRVAETAKIIDPEYVPIVTADPAEGAVRVIQVPRDSPDLDMTDPRQIIYRGRRYLSTVSHLRLARSRDGRHFTIDRHATVAPRTPYEIYGIEDPRITPLGEEGGEGGRRFLVTYTAVSDRGVCVGLLETRDFVEFRRLGIIFTPDNKDVVIFPSAIDGRYVVLHRPSGSYLGSQDIWLAYSDNLLYWGDHRHLVPRRPGMWDGARVGAGAVPFKTPEGWLEIYHGADSQNHYYLGAVLLDLHDPSKVLARSRDPLMSPLETYEQTGFFKNTVFTCGVVPQADGGLRIYYGAADQVTAVADTTLDAVMDSLR